MSNKAKELEIKNRNIRNNFINKKVDSNKIKIDEKLYKNILIYYIGYVTITDSKYIKIKLNQIFYTLLLTK